MVHPVQDNANHNPVRRSLLKVTSPVARFRRSTPKKFNESDSWPLLFFFLSFFKIFFYSFGLSSEDLSSLTELRMSEAFRELWAFSVKFLLSVLRGFSKKTR